MKEKTPEVSPTAKEDCYKRKNNQILTCPTSVTMTLGRTVKVANLNSTPELAQCLNRFHSLPMTVKAIHTLKQHGAGAREKWQCLRD